MNNSKRFIQLESQSLTIDPIFQVEDEKQRKISMVGSLVNLFMESNKQRATESMEQRKPKTNPFKVIFDTVATYCLKTRLPHFQTAYCNQVKYTHWKWTAVNALVNMMWQLGLTSNKQPESA